MKFHWQNLNERPTPAGEPQVYGPPTNGRCWLHFTERLTAKLQWVLGDPWHLGVRVGVDPNDDEVELHVKLPLLQLYFGMEGVLPRAVATLLKYEPHTVVGAHLHGGDVRWKVAHSDHRWEAGTPRWRDGHFNVFDWLLGEEDYSEREVFAADVTVPMPEREYRARIRILEVTTMRPLWPSKRFMRAQIEMENGEAIPIPGKGENSYDCGDDAIHSMSTPAATIPEAVAAVVRSALETRLRYGGPDDWRWKRETPPQETP